MKLIYNHINNLKTIKLKNNKFKRLKNNQYNNKNNNKSNLVNHLYKNADFFKRESLHKLKKSKKKGKFLNNVKQTQKSKFKSKMIIQYSTKRVCLTILEMIHSETVWEANSR